MLSREMVDPVIYASYSLADTNRCFARRGVIIGMGKIITERLNLARSLSKADLLPRNAGRFWRIITLSQNSVNRISTSEKFTSKRGCIRRQLQNSKKPAIFPREIRKRLLRWDMRTRRLADRTQPGAPGSRPFFGR